MTPELLYFLVDQEDMNCLICLENVASGRRSRRHSLNVLDEHCLCSLNDEIGLDRLKSFS